MVKVSHVLVMLLADGASGALNTRGPTAQVTGATKAQGAALSLLFCYLGWDKGAAGMHHNLILWAF